MNLKRIASILEKNELAIREVVLDTAQKKGQILFGARAFNVQSPQNLRKKTTDYDILTKKPKKAAHETAETLRRRLREKVDVVKGRHKGTYRVKVGGEFIVDYSQLKSTPKTKNIFGTKVKSIKSIKRSTQKLVKKPGAEFRREKDMDTLSRIKEIERLDKFFQ